MTVGTEAGTSHAFRLFRYLASLFLKPSHSSVVQDIPLLEDFGFHQLRLTTETETPSSASAVAVFGRHGLSFLKTERRKVRQLKFGIHLPVSSATASKLWRLRLQHLGWRRRLWEALKSIRALSWGSSKLRCLVGAPPCDRSPKHE